MIIRTARSLSYVLIAQQICKANRWDCSISRDAVEFDVFIGSQYDVAFNYFLVRPREVCIYDCGRRIHV